MVRKWTTIKFLTGIFILGLVTFTTFKFNSQKSIDSPNVAKEQYLETKYELLKIKNENLKLKLDFDSYKKANPSPQVVPCANHLDSVKPCEIIHVAIVCAGHNASRSVVTLIKSLLFYRKNPVHLHFITDPTAQMILQTLFHTWDVPQLNFSFYSAEKHSQEINWIPNKHYSGLFGLLKLILTNMLPQWLEKVVVLDTDVTFASDVALLWATFSTFSSDQVVGLVENQSDWYLGKLFRNYEPWPALGRGFNTGVMVMDLSKMRKIGWNQLWRLTAEKDLASHYFTSLADQDIINAVLFREPRLVRTLPCRFNVQLSDNTRSESCYGGNNETTDSVRLVHWNSPKKLAVKNKHSDFFRNLYRTFLSLDGNLLRRKLFHCEEDSAMSSSTTEDPQVEDEACYELRQSRNAKYRTHLFYLASDQSKPLEDECDVTWVAQLSLDRLQMIEPLCQLWQGPISLGLYLSDAETDQFESYVSESSCLSSRQNIGYHILFKQGNLYPINLLRNVALDQVRTPFVFLSDIDFLPAPDLYESVKKSIRSLDLVNGNKALVVPAFETQRYQSSTVPRTKAELINGLDLGEIFTFRYHDWPRGHGPTDYSAWRTATVPYQVKWQPDYEPYMVVRSDVTRYDRRFSGFGWNKVSHAMELKAQNYEFTVLPNTYIVHLPHTPSLELSKFRRSALYRKCSNSVKEEFISDLKHRYGFIFKK